MSLTRRRRIVAVLGIVLGAATLAAACTTPPDPGPTGLYLGIQPGITPVVTPRAQPIVWGDAPPIDANYGGTIYAGTGLQAKDPRPALLADGDEPLRLWVADPNNGVAGRPAIVWLHGGGFAVGIESMYGLAASTGKEYAQRGYVSFSVEYRTDTTLVGTGARPPSLCQWVQDNPAPGDASWEARRAQCARNILAAQRDAQGAVRWIRANASRFGVDPNKIAVGGFSAGAVTASNLAYRSDDVGSIAYFPGDDRSATNSRVGAALLASGCTYSTDGGPLTGIGPGDAPISAIHAQLDPAVPYDCIAQTVTTARAAGLVAELTSYCGEKGHANALYNQYKAATDAQWTTFLARELGLYSNMRPPSADAICPST